MSTDCRWNLKAWNRMQSQLRTEKWQDQRRESPEINHYLEVVEKEEPARETGKEHPVK